MKKNLIYLSLLLLSFACSNEDQEFQLGDISNFESKVKKLEFSFSDSGSTPIKFESHELVRIDKEIYLRSYDGEFVTTSLLKKDGDNNLRFGDVSCRSSHCASTSGCIPSSDKKSCTECPNGDCTKSVDSGQGIF